MRHWRNSWGADERKKAQQQVGCSVPPPMDGQLESISSEGNPGLWPGKLPISSVH